jgi:hypothetical protein
MCQAQTAPIEDAVYVSIPVEQGGDVVILTGRPIGFAIVETMFRGWTLACFRFECLSRAQPLIYCQREKDCIDAGHSSHAVPAKQE